MTTKLHIASTIEAVNPNRSRDILNRLASMAVVGAEARGFHQRADQIEVVPGTNMTVDGQSLAEIWSDMQARVTAYNRNVNSMLALLTFPTIRESERVAVYSTARFEQATEFGQPSKVRMAYRRRSFPLDHFDLGIGYTQEYIDDAAGNEITAILGIVRAAYETQRLNVVLNAILDVSPATDRDGITPLALFNNDGEVPEEYKRTTHAGTHTHYLTSTVNNVVSAANLATMEEHLLHHGYGDFGETLVLFVPRANMATVRALTGYIHSSETAIPIVREGMVLGRTGTAPPGLTADGYFGRFVVVESLDLPTNYLVGWATGGQFASQNVVGLRQHRNPSARGLRLVAGPRQNYPLIDSFYDHYVGAGIRHRGAAVAMQLTAGSYTTPTL